MTILKEKNQTNQTKTKNDYSLNRMKGEKKHYTVVYNRDKITDVITYTQTHIHEIIEQ